MSVKNGRKILIGRDSIMDYLDMSRPTFYKFLELGLPVRVINNRLYAHKDNVDDFFRKITRHREKEVPLDVE